MIFIFDFDDVLLNTTDKLVKHTYSVLERAGIGRDHAKEYLEKEILNNFSLKKMLKHFSLPEKSYNEIMKECVKISNVKLIKIIKKIRKDNCYIVTYGDPEFQIAKIKSAEIFELFSEIIVVQGSKKETIENICAKHKDEEVLYIDDKAKHFEDLDYVKYPNLKTILYDKDGLEKVKAEISAN